ncbi:hypothetical protein O181_101204, partial [Austropuccinia psidii MF-1]|nr:hypothetical protein [Austropuccinia psidii MF-1]
KRKIDSSISESSIERQTSPAPRGLITKEPFKGPAEVEAINSSNKMDLYQEIKVINQKDTNVSPEERHKLKMLEFPPVSKEVHRPRKGSGSSEGLETHVLQRPSPTDKARLKNQSILSEDQRKNLAQGKEKSPVEASQASTSKNPPQQVPQKGQENPKEQSEGQEKGKGKGKVQVEQALPTELQNSKERKDSHGQCVQYGKNSDGIKKKG